MKVRRGTEMDTCCAGPSPNRELSRRELLNSVGAGLEGNAAEAGANAVQKLAPAEFPVGRRTGATGIHLGSSSDLHGVLTNSSWFIRALTRTAVAATSAAGSARSRVCSPVARYFSSAPGCDVK